MDRTILHCDLNSFFASVELLEHPGLRDAPVAVCGDPESRHGIILAKNEPAKAFGVKTAETIWQARKKCPALVLLPAHHAKYSHYSRLVNEIYGRYTDLVEPFGIDESWLDVTHSMHLFDKDGPALADELRDVVRRELGLTISVGVSFNKVFAKLGSDYKKPDATTVITRENFRELVWPLPVGSLLFVGRAAERVLSGYGIFTVGDLAAFDRTALFSLLGKQGAQLHDFASGGDRAAVAPQAEHADPKSVGNGQTFRRNLVGLDDVRTGISLLTDSVAARLRRHGLKCSAVQVVIRDPNFKDICRQKRLDTPSHTYRELYRAAMELVTASWNLKAPIRALTVTGLDLVPEHEAGEQTNLFAGDGAPQWEKREKLERLDRAVDRLRGKYGRTVIGFAPNSRDLTAPDKGGARDGNGSPPGAG